MQKRKAGIALVVLGVVLLSAALLLLLYNEEENRQAGEAAEEGLAAVQEQIARASSIPRKTDTPAPKEAGESDAPGTPTPEPTFIPDMPEVRVDGQLYIGYVSIPEMGVELPIISDWDYNKLTRAPCRQFGSLYTDDLVIAGHNYERHFGGLKDLTIGAACTFTDMNGYAVEFALEKREIINPDEDDATERVADSGYDLVLYTCTKGGQTRVVCFFNRVEQ